MLIKKVKELLVFCTGICKKIAEIRERILESEGSKPRVVRKIISSTLESIELTIAILKP